MMLVFATAWPYVAQAQVLANKPATVETGLLSHQAGTYIVVALLFVALIVALILFIQAFSDYQLDRDDIPTESNGNGESTVKKNHHLSYYLPQESNENGEPTEQGNPTKKSHKLLGRVEKRLELAIINGEDIGDISNLMALAEEELTSRVEIPRFIGNASVYVGLLGTLIGLTMAIRELKGLGLANPTEFASAAGAILQGFSGAFTSAITGVICTVIISALITWYSRNVAVLLEDLDRYTQSHLIPSLRPPGPVPISTDPSKIVADIASKVHNEVLNSVNKLAAAAKGAGELISQTSSKAINSIAESAKEAASVIAQANSTASLSLIDATRATAEAAQTLSESATQNLKASGFLQETIDQLSSAKALDKQVASLASIISKLDESMEVIPDILTDIAANVEISSTAILSAQETSKNLAAEIPGLANGYQTMVQDELKKALAIQQEHFMQLKVVLQAHQEYAVQTTLLVNGIRNDIPTVEDTTVNQLVSNLETVTTAISTLSQSIENMSINGKQQDVPPVEDTSVNQLVDEMKLVTTAISALSRSLDNKFKGEINKSHGNGSDLLPRSPEGNGHNGHIIIEPPLPPPLKSFLQRVRERLHI